MLFHTLLESCSYERLVRLLPIVKKNPDSKDELLEMTAKTRRVDFDNNLKEMKGLVPDDQCVNPEQCDAPKIILERCGVCGVTYRRKDLE